VSVGDARVGTSSVLVVSNQSATHDATRVGVIGAGQLARMMGEAAHDVGVTITVLATSLEDSAVSTCDHVIVGDARDTTAIELLSGAVDVLTFDHELVDLEHIVLLEAQGVVVRPSAGALRFAVDKAYQRRELSEAGLPVPRFLVVRSSADARIHKFLDQLHDPPVVKAARGGYDGRGVLFPADRAETLTMIDEVCINGEAVLEEHLILRSEVAQLVARDVDGALVLYPLVTTVQSEGMCVEVRFPSGVAAQLANEAAELATRIAPLIDVVGILAIELFVTDVGLVVNELATRPHNSGHWTIEGARTSPFANHLRAVSGEPLGPTTPTCDVAVMVNVVGGNQPSSLEAARGVTDVHVHDYGKSWRPGRKLGHVTALGDDEGATHVRAWESARAYGTRTREK
jgi:5-(carboxyamino)imidazole ribonucleotide synthase